MGSVHGLADFYKVHDEFQGNLPMHSDGWSTNSDEYVYFRGRSIGGSQATALAYQNYYGTMREGNLTYLSGYGSVGSYYKMAIEYSNDNPYQYVYLNVGWAP